MKKQSVIDQIEITRDGTIQLRIAKEVLDDDGSVIVRDWHRTACPPGHDIDAQMAAVNEQLVVHLKCMPVEASEIARVKSIAPMVWTKEVRDSFAKKQEKANVR